MMTRRCRVVVYLSAELGEGRLFRNLGRQMAAETDCLAGLGPVDVVVADPEPTEILTAEHRSTEVRHALQRAIERAQGGVSVSRLRRNFARDFDRRTDVDSGFGPGATSPGSVVVTTRDAINRELELVRDNLRRLVVWMQTQPPVRAGVLIWMTGGFDLNPAEFYISRVEQIDPVVARSLRADSARFRLDEDLRWLIETALSLSGFATGSGASRWPSLSMARIDNAMMAITIVILSRRIPV